MYSILLRSLLHVFAEEEEEEEGGGEESTYHQRWYYCSYSHRILCAVRQQCNRWISKILWAFHRSIWHRKDSGWPSAPSRNSRIPTCVWYRDWLVTQMATPPHLFLIFGVVSTKAVSYRRRARARAGDIWSSPARARQAKKILSLPFTWRTP